MKKVDLQAGDFKPYYPKVYSVGAMFVDKEFEFDNEFGEGHYTAKTGDVVLEGTKGEHWLVPESRRAVLKVKYVLDGQIIDLSQIAKGHSLESAFTAVATKESKLITWAAQVEEADATDYSPEGYELHVNNSEYSHGGGDFICCADNNGQPAFEQGCWPVNGEVFSETYEPAQWGIAVADAASADKNQQ